MIASLFVAFFAYLGLALGGGINLAARADAEAFSSGKDSQPLYLALRDAGARHCRCRPHGHAESHLA